MVKLLEFKKNKVIINKKEIAKEFSIAFKKNKQIAIIGSVASGKTLVLKAIMSMDYNVFSIFKCSFPSNKTVYEELSFQMKKLCKSEKFIKINKLAKEFEITDYLNANIRDLNKEKRLLVKLLKGLVNEPQIIIVDDLFIYLNRNIKEKIMAYLRRKDITLFLATSDIEDTMYVDYIYIVDKGELIFKGNKNAVYKKEKLLNEIGYGLPFIVDLSVQLGYYNLVSKMYLSKEELVGELWK